MDDLTGEKEPLVRFLRRVIQAAVRIMAVLMTLVIIWGVADVCWVLYQKLVKPPFMMLTMAMLNPVLPEVVSTIVSPGFKIPFFSASSIMYSAILSLVECPGLKASTLAKKSP